MIKFREPNQAYIKCHFQILFQFISLARKLRLHKLNFHIFNLNCVILQHLVSNSCKITHVFQDFQLSYYCQVCWITIHCFIADGFKPCSIILVSTNENYKKKEARLPFSFFMKFRIGLIIMFRVCSCDYLDDLIFF